MNAEIKIYDEDGYIQLAENVQLTDFEIEMAPLSAGVIDGYQHYITGSRHISLSGRIVDYIDRSRKLNRKVLIV